jgi:hypothetical protein
VQPAKRSIAEVCFSATPELMQLMHRATTALLDDAVDITAARAVAARITDAVTGMSAIGALLHRVILLSRGAIEGCCRVALS